MSGEKDEYMVLTDTEFSERLRQLVEEEYSRAIAIDGGGAGAKMALSQMMATLLRGVASLIAATVPEDMERNTAMVHWAADVLRAMVDTASHREKPH